MVDAVWNHFLFSFTPAVLWGYNRLIAGVNFHKPLSPVLFKQCKIQAVETFPVLGC